MKNPDDETTLGGQLHQLGGKLEKAKHKIPGDLHLRVPHPLSNVRQVGCVMTNTTNRSHFDFYLFVINQFSSVTVNSIEQL